MLQLQTVAVDKPETVNFILGQSHFIKSVEDIHEALVGTVPGIRFSSPSARRRASGWCATPAPMRRLSTSPAATPARSAPVTFIVFLGDGCFPVNVLNAIKAVPEVCRIYCASANPTEVIVAETAQDAGSSASSTASGRSGSKMTTTSAGARICCARSATRRRILPARGL